MDAISDEPLLIAGLLGLALLGVLILAGAGGRLARNVS